MPPIKPKDNQTITKPAKSHPSKRIGRPIEYATCAAALRGAKESGDQYVVVSAKGGTLIGVVDGLGHGTGAFQAASAAVEILRQFAHESLPALVERCHNAMRATRGAVMSLAWFDSRQKNLTLLSVGNVEGVLLPASHQAPRRPEYVQLRGGVVGSHLPPLQAQVVPTRPGDILIFATDGIRSGFESDVPFGASAQYIADAICLQYNKGTDDALVLVARFPGVER